LGPSRILGSVPGGVQKIQKMPKNAKKCTKIAKKTHLVPHKRRKNKKDQFSLVSHNNNSSKGCLYKFWALWDFYTHF